MKQNLLTKHCALLLLLALATAWSTPAWADVTINVKAPSAPHMYVWNSSHTPLNGQWPGDVVTDTKVVNGETYYTKTISNENTVSVIFAKDNDTQTGDFSGLTGEVFFHYDGETLAYGNLPDDVAYESSGYFAYFVNTKNWNKVYAYIFDNNDNKYKDWPGTEMTSVHTDGGKQSVYKFGPITDCNITPTKIIFTNGSGIQTQNLDFTNGGYYVYSEYNNGANNRADLVAIIDNSRIKNTATYFADTHFREGITKSLGVAEGAAFTPTDYTILDLSYDSGSMTGKISNLSGIEHFTNLEELDISNNNIPYGDITALTKLKKIVAHHNPSLEGFGIGTPSSSNKILKISQSSVLEYVDVSNNDTYYLTQLNNCCGSTLKTLIASNNPRFDYSTFTGCTALEHLDFSNCGLTSTALNSSHINCPNLEYLDCSGNRNLVSSGVYLTNMTKLKYFDMSGCDATPSTTVANLANAKSTLEYLDLSDNNMSANGNDPALDGFTALQTFKFNTQANWTKALTITNCQALTHIDVNGNVKMTGLTIDNCPSLQEVLVTNNTSLPLLSITNSSLTTLPAITDLTTATALTKIDLTGNAFTAVPTVGGNVTTMVLNNNQLVNIVAPSNIHYLYAQNNNFGSGAYTLPTTSLVGLDLGNNGFTKFKAENNTSLKSLALAGNTALTEIELHGNTALTQTSPDGVIESDNGLYIKGLSNLQILNIENSSFNKLGQQNSLEGVTGLTKLQARHNEFTTFTNGVYALHSVTNSVNYRPADANESSLEHLVNLQYLDLAYNNLRDSVHLYRNKELRHLDVSHNAVITGVKDGTITTKAQKDAMIEKKGKRLMKYNKKYTAAGVNASDANWTTEYTDYQSKLARPFDLRECDLNDTIGLYHLDLQYNTKLEWLDFSNTAIRNTASGPTYMCPGWMDKDWVTDDNLQAVVATAAGHRWYSSWHSFIYLIPCSELKTIHADNNNMQSMGFMYFPKLDTLTISCMYGDCAYMRDYGALAVPPRDITPEDNGYGKGNCGLSGSVRKYVSTTWGTGSDGNATASISFNYIDPETGANYLNPVKYFDVSNSGYNEVRLNSGVNLEYANVSGNPLNYAVHNTGNSYHNSLDVTYCPNIRTVLAENCADLPVVRAHNRTKLDTLYVSNDPNLKVLYVQNDPLLKTNFAGLNTLAGLETLFGYNNTQWGNDINFSSNTALKNLWISNIGASSINVANNANLEKLRAYDNSLTALDLSNNGELLWLDVARNKLPEIDLSGNTKLQFFNISNGSDTRTQLDGTEDLNHDGSDGDAIKPTTIFSADEAPIANANNGNSLSDLALPASIIDARANGNDLHSITGNFANLTNMEFAHNHINGIDLSAAPGATIESRDNGRTIVADCAAFSKKVNGTVQEFKVYFFQLDPGVTGNGTVLTLKDSEDLKGDTRRLGTDGMVINNITWDGTSGAALKNTITPGDMSALDPDDVPGNIVVLNPTSESGNGAEGTATYTYKTGENSTSEFYLNWSSDGTITGVSEIKAEDGVSITNTYGNLTVAGADGTVVGVYDVNGRQIASETISGGKITIDGLAPGIYIVNGNKVLVK